LLLRMGAKRRVYLLLVRMRPVNEASKGRRIVNAGSAIGTGRLRAWV
jgi:hypothetical protein